MIIVIIHELWEEEIWALPVDVQPSHKSHLSHRPGSGAPDVSSSSKRNQKGVPANRPKWRSGIWVQTTTDEFRLSVLGRADRQVRIRMSVCVEDFNHLSVLWGVFTSTWLWFAQPSHPLHHGVIEPVRCRELKWQERQRNESSHLLQPTGLCPIGSTQWNPF